MKDVILTIDIETREVKYSKNFVGISGENLQNNIVVDFVDNNFIDGTAYFEYEIGGEKYFKLMTKSNEYDIYSLQITEDLLQTAGKLTIQIKIVNNTAIFKSKKFVLPVLEAIQSENVIITVKNLLDTTQSAAHLFEAYTGNSVDNLIGYSDTENVTRTASMFASCPNLTTVPLLNTSNVQSMVGMFYNCSSLKSIPAYDVSNVTTFGGASQYMACFYGCTNLEEIHMTGMSVSFSIVYSTKFTETALVEILNNLATVTSTQTLTMGATNLAKLTAEEKAIATSKGWTLA